jgi:multiple RNA-binding domain-containing protein 1
VANSIADRLGISKSDIVNPDSSGVGGSAAVKLALAETHIISETKKYFEEVTHISFICAVIPDVLLQRNVDLSLFSQPRTPRSKTIILVKNIPYGISVPKMTELFNAFGRVRRVLLPPAGTIAIVEFAHGQEKEASNAWKGLAYKRLKDSILYLEWAPQGLFDGAPPISDATADAVKTIPKNASNVASRITNESESDGDEEAAEAVPEATLHIGNLSFATTSERLTSIFRHLPSFAFAKVVTKIDPAKPGELLSQGFGFVGFKDVEGAKKALKGIAAGTGSGAGSGSREGLVLDGHVLRVNFAGRGKEEMEMEKGGAGIGGKSGKGKGTKLIVKNLAFEVSRKELWELFRCAARECPVYVAPADITLGAVGVAHMARSNLFVYPIVLTGDREVSRL